MSAQIEPKREKTPISRAATLKAALMKAFTSIGTRNGHAAPSASSEQLHTLFVYNEGRAFFEKMYKSVLSELLLDPDISNKADSLPGGESTVLLDQEFYSFVLRKNNASEKLDVEAFVTALRRAGVSQEVIEGAKSKALVKTIPARRFEVIPK